MFHTDQQVENHLVNLVAHMLDKGPTWIQYETVNGSAVSYMRGADVMYTGHENGDWTDPKPIGLLFIKGRILLAKRFNRSITLMKGDGSSEVYVLD